MLSSQPAFRSNRAAFLSEPITRPPPGGPTEPRVPSLLHSGAVDASAWPAATAHEARLLSRSREQDVAASSAEVYEGLVDEIGRDLRSYYEAEARQRSRLALRGRRNEVREEFLELLAAEGRRSVGEFGAGPGLDGERFVEAGHRYVGCDLAHGNALLADERGVTVVTADVTALPFPDGAFEAGWSMSTLMHLPESRLPDALRELVRVLQPGAPLLIGMWGGAVGDVISDRDIPGERRLFSLRPYERNRELFSAAADVEWSTTWDPTPETWTYQLFRLRTRRSQAEGIR